MDEMICETWGHPHPYVLIGVRSIDVPTDVEHYAKLIYLNSGEKFVLDIAGAQYGHDDYILPVRDYLRFRARSITKREGSGATRAQLMTKIRRSEASPHPISLVWALDCQYALAMEKRLKEWEEMNDQTFAEMLGLPEEQYVTKRVELLITLHDALVDRREELVEDGIIHYSEEGITFATDESWKLKTGIPMTFTVAPST